MPHHPLKLELLKQQALNLGLSKNQIREFGSLTKRETWEKAIVFRNATTRELEWKEIETVDNVIYSSVDLPSRSSNFLTWNFPQLIALSLVAVGFFVLVAPALRKIPSLFPIKITIQVGKI